MKHPLLSAFSSLIVKTVVLITFFSSFHLFSQTSFSCPSPYVYMDGGAFIQFYNPSLPLSATNPSNTNVPTFGGGLTLMPNINTFTPSPTFYTTSGGNYYYWNGTTWVNTGHSTGNASAVNLGGCGGKIYNLVGSTGQVYVYSGTGPGTLLTTIAGFSGGGPYDIVTDCNCNFYLLNTTTPNQKLTLYSPTGSVLCTWTMTGMPNTSAGGGFAIIGNTVYVKNNLANGFFIGTMGPSAITFTQVTGFTASPGDFASCPVCNTMSVTASNTGTIGCSTPSVNVIATTTASPVTYSWSGPGIIGATTNSIAAVNMGGVYTCTVTKAGCPPDQTIVTTTVISNGVVITPTLAVSNTITCANPTATITAIPGPAGYTYTWTGPGIVGANSNQAVTVNTAGIYTVAMLSSTSTCAGTGTITVSTNTTPPLVLCTPTNTTICAGTNAQFTGSGAVSYLWNTGAPTSTINVSPTSNTSYTVTGTAANGCTATAIGTASVIALPVPLINSNSPVCVNGTLTLNASGGTSYLWMGPNSFSSNIQSPNIANVSMLANGNYTVTATVGICTGSTTSNAVINPLPVPTATNSGPVCDGQGVAFMGTGGLFYAWTGPASFSSTTQNPGIPNAGLPHTGTYFLNVTDANGCKNSTTTNLLVNPLPVIATSGSTVCANTTMNLSANGGSSYSWTGPGGFTSNQQNPSVPNAQPSMAGLYNVTVTDANGCVNTSSATVFINPIPTPSASNNGPVCLNQLAVLNASGGLYYNWNGPNGFSSSVQSPTFNANVTGLGGNYTVTATDNIGCSGIAVTNITVNNLPSVSVLSSGNKGCVPLCVSFTCATSAGATVTWIFGDGSGGPGITSSACYNVPADYTVTAGVVDANGCANSNTYNVFVYPIPHADFNYAPYIPIENVSDVEFTDASYGATVTSWQWYFTNTAQYTSVIQNPTFLYSEAGNYAITLVAKSNNGCTDTVTKTILVSEDFGVFVPNAFTPNADGLNDVFYAKGYGVTGFKMEIYDRWGGKVFMSSDMNDSWDGTHMQSGNKILQEGVYTWKISLSNVFGKSKELTGHVTLIK